jgi:hypothetical protein
MNALSLILPVLLIVFGLALVVRGLAWLADMLWSIKEQPGLYPPLKVLMYGLVGFGMTTFVIAGGGLVALLKSIIQW